MALILLFLNRRSINNALNNQMLLVYGAGIVILALLGGTHTERFFFWGYVFFLPLAGWIIKNIEIENSKIAIGTIAISFLVLQIIAQRTFTSMPDFYMPTPERPEYFFLAPYGDLSHFRHIFPFFMPSGIQRTLFFQYCGLFIYFLSLRFLFSSKAKNPRS